MPNHGYCKNCWWYKLTKNPSIKFENGKLHEYAGEGICYMFSGNIGSENAEVYHYTNDNNYCPDYWNRKQAEKTDGTLDDWLKKIYDKKY